MSKFTGKAESYKDWRHSAKALFDREPWMKMLVKAVETEALKKDTWTTEINKMTLKLQNPDSGDEFVFEPRHWEEPETDSQRLVVLLAENMFQVLQVLLEGTSALVVQNLEESGPSRGLETWAKLLRDFHGEHGPRILSLCDDVFYPTKVKMEEVGTAVATHEAAVKRLITGDTKAVLDLMLIYGLRRVLP